MHMSDLSQAASSGVPARKVRGRGAALYSGGEESKATLRSVAMESGKIMEDISLGLVEEEQEAADVGGGRKRRRKRGQPEVSSVSHPRVANMLRERYVSSVRRGISWDIPEELQSARDVDALQEQHVCLSSEQLDHTKAEADATALAEVLRISKAAESALEVKLSELTEQHAHLKSDLAAHKIMTSTLEARAQVAEATRDEALAALENKAQFGKAEIELARSAIEEARRDGVATKTELAASQQQVSDLKGALNAAVESWQMDIQQSQAAAEAKAKEAAAISKKLEQVQEKVDVKENELFELRKKLEEKIEAKEKKLNAMEEKMEAKDQQLKDLQQELDNIKAARSSAASDITALEARLADSQGQCASLKAANASATSDIEALEAKLVESHGQYAALESDHSVHRARASEEASAAAETLEAALAAKTAAEAKLAQLEEQHAVLRSDLSEHKSKADEDASAAVESLEASNFAKKAIEARLAELEEQHTSLKSDFSAHKAKAEEDAATFADALQASESAKSAARANVAKLEEQNADLGVELADQKNKVTEGKTALEAAKSSAASKIAALEAKLAESQTQYAALESNLLNSHSSAGEALKASDAAKAPPEERVAKLENQSAELESELETQKGAVAEGLVASEAPASSINKTEPRKMQIRRWLEHTGLLEDDAKRYCALVYDESMCSHRGPSNHLEQPNRLKEIWKQLDEAGLVDACKRICSRQATQDELLYVHTEEHIMKVRNFQARDHRQDGKSGTKKFAFPFDHDPDTYMCEKSYCSALISAGSFLNLLDHTMETDSNLHCGMAVIRPPGHHASQNKTHGFCLFNNVAIGACHLQKVHGLRRILIVDWDVHHGDGTESIFVNSQNVSFFSMHRYDGNFFPCSGGLEHVAEGPAERFSVNAPLPKGYNDADANRVLRDVLGPLAERFLPQAILVSAGFDAVSGDPLGGCSMTPEGFGEMTRYLYQLARKHSKGFLFLALEGGYDCKMIARCTLECVNALVTEANGVAACGLPPLTSPMSLPAASSSAPPPSSSSSAPKSPMSLPKSPKNSPKRSGRREGHPSSTVPVRHVHGKQTRTPQRIGLKGRQAKLKSVRPNCYGFNVCKA